MGMVLSGFPPGATQAQGLSGGEAQKVALARALVLQPQLLILDEPFNHLDKGFRLLLEDCLRELVKHDAATVILTTHDQFLAQTLADQVFNLIMAICCRWRP